MCVRAVTYFRVSLRIKAPILLRAFPILNSLLPLKIKEAQSATKMHIHKLAVGRARDAIDAAGAEFAQTDAYDGPGASKVVGSTASVDMHLMRWKESRNNLLSDLGGWLSSLPNLLLRDVCALWRAKSPLFVFCGQG